MTVSYRFGRFELRPSERQLLADEKPVAVGARAFNILVVLVERREQLVSKDELFELVWPGLVVEENNLQVQLSALRKLVGQDAIATVSGHGYRFTPEVSQAATARTAPARAAKHNLPAKLSSFVRRESDLADLRGLLEQHRLVTVTGVGGIGKTRLALELAWHLLDGFGDGVWFADLAAISDPSQVPSAIAAMLGVREEAGRPVTETLRRFSGDKSLLVILDNCEHLLAGCAQLAKDLLQAGERLRILVTSREPLHVSGEVTYPLAALAAPDPRSESSLDVLREYAAVQLFLERARAVRSDFSLTRQNAVSVARICHDLDGIPLALELAAARMRAMSPESIAEHLADRFRLLRGGDPTAMPRQQTLRATIDWSYELLAPEERALLYRLSVFAGGFAFDGAQAVSMDVAAGDFGMLDALARLVDKSLVVFDARTERYKMLETVRQYALERLAASGEDATIRDRHLQCYVELAQRAGPEMNGPQQASWHARLDAERENIILAFAHARHAPGGGVAGLALIQGLSQWLGWSHVELWRQVTRQAIEHPDAQQDTILRSRALYISCQTAYHTGRYTEALTLAEESTRIARTSGDARVLAEALYRLGVAAAALERFTDAHEYFVAGLALARQEGDTNTISGLSGGLGELYSQQDKFELAEAAYLESQATCQGDSENTMLGFCNLARVAVDLRDEVKASRYLVEAVRAGEGMYTILTTHAVLMGCAGLAALRGEWTFSLRLTGASEAHCDQHGLVYAATDGRSYARHKAGSQKALGDAAAATALAAGRALHIDTAFAEALAWLESVPTASTAAVAGSAASTVAT